MPHPTIDWNNQKYEFKHLRGAYVKQSFCNRSDGNFRICSGRIGTTSISPSAQAKGASVDELETLSNSGWKPRSAMTLRHLNA
jgi:hypothetical protein